MADQQIENIIELLEDLDGYGLLVTDEDMAREALDGQILVAHSLEDVMSILADLDGDGVVLVETSEISERLTELGYEREFDEIYTEDVVSI